VDERAAQEIRQSVVAVAPAPEAAPKAAATAPAVVPVIATTGSTAEPPKAIDTRPSDATSAALVVQVHANGECWIDASADGEQKAYRLLMPGEELRLEGAKEIRMLVGDAAAVTYSINGKPGVPSAPPASSARSSSPQSGMSR
jgi:hypothetical protein